MILILLFFWETPIFDVVDPSYVTIRFGATDRALFVTFIGMLFPLFSTMYL